MTEHDEALEEARFLLGRLSDFERGLFGGDNDLDSQWCGHVAPSAARLHAAIEAISAGAESVSPSKTREAVETEREACARVAEDKANTNDFRARMVIAAAIRARGQS